MHIHISPHTLGAFLAWMVRYWGATLRITRRNAETFFDPDIRTKRPIILLWHDEIFPLIPSHANDHFTCVVSQSRDGEILAQVLERFGLRTVRGSSSRGGLRALIAAKKNMTATGCGVIFTVDGPRGPRHKVKPGAVFLAEHTGSPIIPVRVLMRKAYVFHKAWDKFQLPWPWSGCEIRYGDPMYLPPTNGDEAMLHQHCLCLEQAMHNLGEN